MLHQPDLTVNAAGHLALDGADTVALAEKYGTPLYLVDEDLVRERMTTYVNAVKEGFPGGSMPLYASKALSFKEMYRIAKGEGMGVDVVSSGELYTALAADFPAENICFHGNAKTDADVRYAIRAGVGHIVADSWEELERIDRAARELSRRQQVLLRVTPGIDPHTFRAVNTGVVDVKFGIPIPTGQALNVTKRILKELSHVALDGFHCHIGSQVFTAEPIYREVDAMFEFAAEVRQKLGYTAGVLNLGGGLAVAYEPGDAHVDYAHVLQCVGERIAAQCEKYAYPAPAVMLEPGRSIVGDAGITLYTVQNVKHVTGGCTYVAVDGGMTDNPRYALYGARHSAVVANRAEEAQTWQVTVAGRCCESGDLIGENVALQPCAAGDTLAVLVTGAYCYSMASHYNRTPVPPVVLIRGGADRLAVRRETPEDVAAFDI